MERFNISDDEICLLGSEEELDTGKNNTSQNKLPSHLEFLGSDATAKLHRKRDETDDSFMNKTPKRGCCTNSRYFVLGIASLSAVGGVLLGYDVGIISGALIQVSDEFHLTCFQEEIAVSAMLLGAIVSSCLAGILVDCVGRKRSIIINSMIFVFGSLVLATSTNFTMLVTGRIVIGFAVALSVIAECIYVSEISPPRRRGMLVSLNEFAITIGFLLAYLMNYALIHSNFGWRVMFSLAAIPAVAQGIGMCFLPSSPRYLLLRQRELEARQVLERLYDGAKAEMELDKLKAALQEERSHSTLDLCRGTDNLRYRLGIAVGLVVLQQLSGQPNVLYYAPTVLQQVGYPSATASVLASVGLGAIKVLSCLFAILLLDYVGRRKLMLFGVVTMTISITALGAISTTIPHSHVTNCDLLHTSALKNKTTTSSNISSTTLAAFSRNLELTSVAYTKDTSTVLSTSTSTILSTTSTIQKVPTSAMLVSTSSSQLPSTTTTTSPVLPLETTGDNEQILLDTTAITEILSSSSTPTILTSTQDEGSTIGDAFKYTTSLPSYTTEGTDDMDKSTSIKTTYMPSTSFTTQSLYTEEAVIGLVDIDNNHDNVENSNANNTASETIDSSVGYKNDSQENTYNNSQSQNLPASGVSLTQFHSTTTVSEIIKYTTQVSSNLWHRRDLAQKERQNIPQDDTSIQIETLTAEKHLPLVSLILLCAYVAGFELSFGTGTWLILSEIFPSAVRGRAIAIATVMNWSVNLLISITFLNVLNTLGTPGTFFPYGIICAVSVVFLWLYLPETRGRTLEEIGQDLNSRSATRALQPCSRICCKQMRTYQHLDAEGDIMMDDRLVLHESD